MGGGKQRRNWKKVPASTTVSSPAEMWPPLRPEEVPSEVSKLWAEPELPPPPSPLLASILEERPTRVGNFERVRAMGPPPLDCPPPPPRDERSTCPTKAKNLEPTRFERLRAPRQPPLGCPPPPPRDERSTCPTRAKNVEPTRFERLRALGPPPLRDPPPSPPPGLEAFCLRPIEERKTLHRGQVFSEWDIEIPITAGTYATRPPYGSCQSSTAFGCRSSG